MQWLTIYNKELLESARNFKWIWVPLVFILLSIIDPLSTYYLPQILEATGGLPDGATIDMPTPRPSDVLMMSISQLNMLGVLVIALITMGTISGERKSGVAELVLVKPIPYHFYTTAKWAAHMTLILTSILLGLLASWYYVNLLFDPLSFSGMLTAFLFYSLWIMLIVSISLFMNALTKSPGLVLFLTISTVILMNLLTSVFSHLLEWSPAMITSYLPGILQNGEMESNLMFTSLITAVVIIALLFGATYTLKHKEIA
ncbi:ABC transporter permease [Halobacillus sp. H74]|uniref:ABC transporter permease n=1 Tax=Halobacillus sp. H74 TaxID=3457436 RepID=UPI003FCDBC93